MILLVECSCCFYWLTWLVGFSFVSNGGLYVLSLLAEFIGRLCWLILCVGFIGERLLVGLLADVYWLMLVAVLGRLY